jgi:DNA-binding winged helix-turn-helix (wHTH) protein/Tol biopolymer transport system component
MLKSHRNLLEQRPSDRLRIGDRLVDLSLREIVPENGSAEPVRITLKSIGVLLVLVAHAGKLVSREALLEWVWPDTLPTDDVVTQAVAQLRKALGDERERPRYIDTVSKQGYRLIAAVEWLVETDTDNAQNRDGGRAGLSSHAVAACVDGAAIAANVLAGSAVAGSTFADGSGPAGVSASRDAAARQRPDALRDSQSRPRWRTAATIGGATAVALAASAATAYWLLRDQASSLHPQTATSAIVTGKPTISIIPAYQLIASKLQGEYRPSLSPDGALVAYVEEGVGSNTSSLWVQTTAPVPPQRLTEPVGSQWDMMPAWSPDGRQIAFIRENKQRCSVMLIPATGGSAREVGDCLGGTNHRLAWYPDGKTLIAAQTPSNFTSLSSARVVEKALYRMSLANGRWERIPYDRSPSDEDMAPTVSPDGRWIAFQRNLSLGDIWRIPSAGGKPERLTSLRGNLYGIAWMPDNRGLVFGRYVDGQTVLAALDFATMRVRDFKDSSRNSLLYPSIARNGSAIAFELETSHIKMRSIALVTAGERMPAGAEQASAEQPSQEKSSQEKSPLMRSSVLFESTGSNLLPSIAPDGRQIIFSSDRSAEMRLWWADQTRPETLRVFDGFVPVARYPVLWDAASRHALAIGEGTEGMGVYEIDPERGRMVKLPIPDANPVHAAYHPDPTRFLVVADRGEGRLGVRLYDRSVRPWRMLAEIDDIALALVDAANARIVLARVSSADIWQTDLSLGQPRKIDQTAIQRRNRTLVASPEGMWVMDSRPGCEWRWRLVARPGNARSSEMCLGSTDWGLVGISYHPGQRRVYLSMLEEVGSDIALMPLSALERVEQPLAVR